MDLKLKGISWAGNFYQKFEKVCHEVDNIVNEEAVKYVENHVQSVGKNMKKFYSDVITDMLHPLMDPVKHNVQEKSLERDAAIHSHIESEMGIDKNHADKENEKSHFEQSEFDSLEAANSEQEPIQTADAFTDKLKFEESTAIEKPGLNEVSELTSPRKEDFFGDSLQSEFVACNDEISQQFPDEINVVTSVLREECQSIDNVITFPNSFVDDSKCVSDSSSALTSTEMMRSVSSSEKNMVDTVDLRSRSPLRETFLLEISNENASASAVSCHNPVDVDGFISHTELPFSLSTITLSSENKGSESGLISSSIIPSSEFSNSLSTLRSTEMTSSVVSSEKNVVNAVDISTMSPLSGSFLLDNSNENSSAGAASCHSTVDAADFISQTVPPFPSSLSSPTLSGEKMVSETGLISSSSVLSSELIGPSDDSNDEDNVSSMETIDLCDRAKLEDSCVYVDNSGLYAVSHTLRKHRSYKQMLRDALTARKRLVKEYEQLAIWFGDADMGSDMQSLLPSTAAATTMGIGDSLTELEGDSGWELL